ncbi:iron-sulfur cluster assembly protein [Amycolatopsis sp. NPDC004368]
MTAATAETLTSRVRQALAGVVDPEFHEPITNLGFVAGVHVRLCEDRGHSVSVRLRLPAQFCSPELAYVLVADAHNAVLALPCVDTVDIVLEDHPSVVEVLPAPRTGVHVACLEQAVRDLAAAGWQVDALSPGRPGDGVTAVQLRGRSPLPRISLVGTGTGSAKDPA